MSTGPRILLFLALAGGCGYRVVDPAVGGGRSIAVPTAVNDTRWRGLEATLTDFLRRDLQRQLDLSLTGSSADLQLLAEIREVGRQAPVRSDSGGAALGASTVQVHWRLLDAAGQELASGTSQRTLEFRPDQRENPYSALTELLDAMAEHVVIEVGSGLSAWAEQS
ncbi:MAG: hypothetical protein EYC70_00135 [Planctomycetota bacterium]|nr:MAG: hypothetical protein EYC70_00135 [Planctomycetota bacterium]